MLKLNSTACVFLYFWIAFWTLRCLHLKFITKLTLYYYFWDKLLYLRYIFFRNKQQYTSEMCYTRKKRNPILIRF